MLSVKKMQEIARKKLNIQDTNDVAWKIVTSKAHKLEPNKFLSLWGPGLVNTCAYLATGFVNCLAFNEYIHCTRELIQTLHIEKEKIQKTAKEIFDAGLMRAVVFPQMQEIAAILYYILLTDLEKCKTENVQKFIDILKRNGYTSRKCVLEQVNYTPLEQEYIYILCDKYLWLGQQKTCADEFWENHGYEPNQSEFEEAFADARRYSYTNPMDTADGKFTITPPVKNGEDFPSIIDIVASLWVNAFAEGVFLHKTAIGVEMLGGIILGRANFIPEFQPTDPCPEYKDVSIFSNKSTLRPLSRMANIENISLYCMPHGFFSPKCEKDKPLSVRFTPMSWSGKEVDVDFNGLSASVSIDTIISRYSGTNFISDKLFLDSDFYHKLMDSGLNPSQARDAALIGAALRVSQRPGIYAWYAPLNSLYNMTSLSQDWVYEKENAKEARPTEATTSSDVSQKEYEVLRLRNKELEKSLKSLRHEIAEKDREIEAAKEKEKETNELVDVLEELLNEAANADSCKSDGSELSEEETSSDANATPTDFPVYTKQNIVLFGGRDRYCQDIAELIPDIRIVQPKQALSNAAPLRQADMIFVQTNFLSHSKYYFVRDLAKAHNIPLRHIPTSNPKLSAEFILSSVKEKGLTA